MFYLRESQYLQAVAYEVLYNKNKGWFEEKA